MCIAMAWPLAYVNGNPRIEGVQEGNYPFIITNTDLHDENCVFTSSIYALVSTNLGGNSDVRRPYHRLGS